MAKLGEREFELFETWVRQNRPFFGAFQVPANKEGIRETDLYKQWVREQPIARITPEAARIAERFGPLPPEAVVGEVSPAERIRAAQREAEGALGQIGVTPTAPGIAVPPQPTEQPPTGFRWAFDRDLNRWVPQFAGLTAQQQAQQELSQQQLEFQREQAEPQPVTPYQQEQLELQRQRFQFEQRQAQPQPISPYQEQQFGLQQQQFGLQQQQVSQQQAQFQEQLAFQQAQAQAAQEEQERQYRSQLAANPISWLQYAAYTGEQPVVQPWMVPLGFQNTGGTVAPQGLQAGQPIPGFQGQAGQQGQQTFAGLPQLRTPSAQLQARWGPTAQAQFLGYRQARTGAPPAETQFRLGAQRPPTGRFGGFSRFR